MQLPTRCQLDFFIYPVFAFRPVYIRCYNLIFCLYRNQNIFKMPFRFCSEYITWHRRDKLQFTTLIPEKFFLFNGIYTSRFITFSIQVIQILDNASFRKGYCQSIHCMMTMVIPFTPVFYITYFTTIFVIPYICKP